MSERKKSWREIDRLRDNPSAGRRQSRPGRPDSSSARYKRLLDEAFEKGEIGKLAEALAEGAPEPVPGRPPRGRARKGPNRQKLLHVLRNEAVPSKARELFLEYVEHFGLPEDQEALVVGLDLPEGPLRRQVLQALLESVSQARPRRTGTLRAKLRLLVDDVLETDEETRDLARRVLELL